MSGTAIRVVSRMGLAPILRIMRFTNSRHIAAPTQQVFAAISDPARLARWWGPAGFTNTFDVCEFKAGGRWLFVMHGPDGKNYPNESVFEEIEAPATGAGRVVISHVCEPKFRLTITLTPAENGTEVGWVQEFENSEFGRRFESILTPANEQNLDRLTRETLGPTVA